MHPIIRNIIAVVAGVVLGSVVNMGIVMISGSIIPPPEGADVSTMEGLRNSMPLFQPIHFLFPFLAHAIGTLIGAFLTAIIAAKNKIILALLIGVFFLAGGIYSVVGLPSPLWFTIVDLVGAYIPMAWMGGLLGKMALKNRSR